MTTSKLPSGKWRTRVYIDGKQISFTASTRAESVRLATQAAGHLEFTGETIGSVLNRYIDERRNLRSPNTIAEYERTVKRYFMPYMGVKISKVNRAWLQMFVNDLKGKMSPKSVMNVYGLLSSALKKVCNIHYEIDLPKIPPKTYHIPSESDFKTLIDKSSPELKKALLLSGIGSLRRSEICGLLYRDIDGNRLHVCRAMILVDKKWILKDYTKTNSSDRWITLPDEVIELLGHGKPDQRVIPVYPSTITSDFINLRNSLGLKCRFHDMRHYYVSLAHSMGIPDRVIQDRGGFSTDKTLKAVYRNSVKEDEEVYNELWNEYMMKKLAID